MGFDLATAKPVEEGGGFDLSSARPVDPKWVPDSAPPAAPPQPDRRSFAQRADARLSGMFDAGATMLTGATGGLLGRAGGTIGGIGASVLGGTYGTQEGAAGAAQTAEDWARRFTYQPRTEEGKALLESIGRAFEASKLGGLGPAEAVAVGNVAPVMGQATRQAGNATARTVGRVMAKDIPDAPMASDLSGVGAAAAIPATIRGERAAQLPVPIDLTKGQLTRDFAQQQFEREAAKNAAIGAPLRERFAQQNQQILQNFDAWLDQTGAEAGSLRATGEAVTQAITNKSQMAKQHIRNAYEKARESGAMAERVDVSPLKGYLEEHQAEAINAPLLTSVEKRLEQIGAKGTASINDLEEVRKMVGRLSGKDATNALFGREVKGVIDSMTEDKGGDLYKQARKLRFQYGKEFEDHAVIDRLLSNKPGTQDRAVAYEDVFKHSILSGSLDDVKTISKTLQTAGTEGEQAWRELQGETIQHIKDEITKNVQTDQTGTRVISPARLDRIVTELDKDGKLDFIFGKQGAQQIRDVNGIAQDAFTAPPGAVNSSNTASALINALDMVAKRTTGIPFLGSATGYISGEMKNAKARQRVSDALNNKEGR